MPRADDLKGILNLIILVVVAAGSLLGPLLERWRKKRAEQKEAEQVPRADPDPEPEPEGAKLPYEHLVDEVFGPYMQRRRQAFAERQAAQAEEEEAEAEETPEPPEPAALVPEEPIRILKSDAPVAPPPPRTLEQRLFGGRDLKPGAKWILAAEIFQPPKYLRRRPS